MDFAEMRRLMQRHAIQTTRREIETRVKPPRPPPERVLVRTRYRPAAIVSLTRPEAGPDGVLFFDSYVVVGAYKRAPKRKVATCVSVPL